MEPEIIVTHIANSSRAGQEQRFRKACVTVGRDTGTDIDFDPDEDLVVSHNHCELYVEDGRLFIRDLNSRNGTYVNQRRIGDPVELHPDDSIHFGYGGPLAKARIAEPEMEVDDSRLRGTLLSNLLPRRKPRSENRPAPEALSMPPAPPAAVPAYEARLDEDSFQEGSVHEASVHEAPVHESSVHESSVHEAPVHEAPGYEGSVYEASAAPQPAPRRPAAPQPVVRRPAAPQPAMPRPAVPQPVVPQPAAPRPAMPAPQPQAPGRSFGLLPIIVLALVFGVGGAAGYAYLWPWLTKQFASTAQPTATADAPAEAVAALGRLEPDGGVLAVGGPAGQTLKVLLVEEGQTVKRDDPLAHLSSYDPLAAEYDTARTALDEATAQLQSTNAYAAAMVEEARAALQQTGKPLDREIEALEAQLELLRNNLQVAIDDRQQLEKLNLAENSTQLSRQRLVEQGVRREQTATEKKLEELRSATELRRAAAQAQLQTALANQTRMGQSISLKNAQKNVERAKAQLEQAIIRAPEDGKILKILTRAGAALGGPPILQLGDTRHLVVVAEVYETEVRYVAKGQRAIVTSPALPERIRGEVDKVLWTISRNKDRALDPTTPEDLRVVQVQIRLADDEVAKHAALLEKLINLQVTVRIMRD